MPELDPFSQVYCALWKLLDASEIIRTRCRVGNRIRFDGEDRSPEKTQVSTADLPEIRIVPVSTTPHPHRTSNSCYIMKRYSVQITSGERRLTADFFSLEFEVYRALANWQSVLTGLTWKGATFVKMSRQLESRDEGITPSNDESVIAGWVTVWQCDVEMWFSTASLLTEL